LNRHLTYHGTASTNCLHQECAKLRRGKRCSAQRQALVTAPGRCFRARTVWGRRVRALHGERQLVVTVSLRNRLSLAAQTLGLGGGKSSGPSFGCLGGRMSTLFGGLCRGELQRHTGTCFSSPNWRNSSGRSWRIDLFGVRQILFCP
jgi:hypothetical protein